MEKEKFTLICPNCNNPMSFTKDNVWADIYEGIKIKCLTCDSTAIRGNLPV